MEGAAIANPGQQKDGCGAAGLGRTMWGHGSAAVLETKGPHSPKAPTRCGLSDIL